MIRREKPSCVLLMRGNERRSRTKRDAYFTALPNSDELVRPGCQAHAVAEVAAVVLDRP